MQRVKQLRCEVQDGQMVLLVTADQLPDVDLWGGQKKGKLFEKVFGVKLLLAWQPTGKGKEPVPIDTPRLPSSKG
jgi:hypothetical protein